MLNRVDAVIGPRRERLEGEKEGGRERERERNEEQRAQIGVAV
jgi:hypothetical protein